MLKLKFINSSKPESYPSDYTPDEIKLIHLVKGLTMTSHERQVALIRAVNYLVKNNISGDFVECGVWRGGNAIIMDKVLKENGVNDRKIWLYDTFSGMTDPTELDRDFRGDSAKELLEIHKNNEGSLITAICSLDEVKDNLYKKNIGMENVNFIVGDILETIPANIPESIALLRLDTDWFKSTYHELKHLYARVSKYGVIIIDDYGQWRGAKEATDRFFSETETPVFLHRIDMTGRLIIKPD